MKWYAASIIVFVRYKDGIQNAYPIMENVVLIQAETDDEAYKKASIRALAYEGDSDGTFCWDDRPASAVFGGIRKVVECVDSDSRPGDGTEVSYSMMEVVGENNLNKLIDGESVAVIYEE
jgi:hypothetical protein